MNKLYLLLGGNEGDRMKNLAAAKALIALRVGKIAQSSAVYETAAWGKTNQPDFLNQAIAVDTKLDVFAAHRILQKIETELGRQRIEHWGQRTLDIDLLFYNKLILNTEKLTIPHPRIQDRRFALVPLCEINADFVHPIFDCSLADLLAKCNDLLEVKRHKN